MLRQRAGEPSFAGGFIDHYIAPIIYPNMTIKDQYVIGVILLLYTVAIYLGVYWRYRSARR
jgi:hypothetical protein